MPVRRRLRRCAQRAVEHDHERVCGRAGASRPLADVDSGRAAVQAADVVRVSPARFRRPDATRARADAIHAGGAARRHDRRLVRRADLGRVAAAAARRSRARLAQGPFVERDVLDLRVRVIEPMQDRRLYLSGDAAHLITPAGGKGMNLAIQDAIELGLALRERYTADPRGKRLAELLRQPTPAHLAHARVLELDADPAPRRHEPVGRAQRVRLPTEARSTPRTDRQPPGWVDGSPTPTPAWIHNMLRRSPRRTIYLGRVPSIRHRPVQTQPAALFIRFSQSESRAGRQACEDRMTRTVRVDPGHSADMGRTSTRSTAQSAHPAPRRSTSDHRAGVGESFSACLGDVGARMHVARVQRARLKRVDAAFPEALCAKRISPVGLHRFDRESLLRAAAGGVRPGSEVTLGRGRPRWAVASAT